MSSTNVPAVVKKENPCKPCKPCPPRPFLIYGLFKFCNKALIAGSLIYYTAKQGAWGTQEESYFFLNHCYDNIKLLMPIAAKIIWSETESED